MEQDADNAHLGFCNYLLLRIVSKLSFFVILGPFP